MLRKRRKGGKKNKSHDIPKTPGISLPGKVSEPYIEYPDTGNVLDYSKIIHQRLPKSKQKQLSNKKRRQIN